MRLMPDARIHWPRGTTLQRSVIVAFSSLWRACPPRSVAVFDNDGTLWARTEPIELGFILKLLADMAEKDDSLRPPAVRAPHRTSNGWRVITKHYAGEMRRQILMGGLLRPSRWTVETITIGTQLLHDCEHPA